MVLRSGYVVVATKLQEAATLLSDNDKRRRLEDTLQNIHRGTGKWAYLVDVVGSDVIYSCDGDLRKAPYAAGTNICTIDTAAAKDVFPFTTYVEEQDEVAVGEAGARHSKSDMGQLQSIHDAATSLGACCQMAESAKISAPVGKVILRECAAWSEDIKLQESVKSDYEIKLIAPGRGATAYYTPEVLRRDGPTAFPAETKVYLNHPTQAQESEGPGNRDVKRLAAVTTRAAEYSESHAQGPGLYARMKVFSDHAQELQEKSPYLAMSILANGEAQMESGRRVMRDGVPVLSKLIGGESVDVVPIAGAGGMILQESAVTKEHSKESHMDETAVKKLIESAVTDAIKAVQQTQVVPLLERALRGDAREEAARILKEVSLPETSKQRVIEGVLSNIPTKDGSLDKEAFTVRVNESAKAEGVYVAALVGSGRVQGMGPSLPAQETDPTKIAAREAAEKKVRESAIDSFQRIMGSKTAAEFAAKGRYQ